MSKITQVLADGKFARVHCETVAESLFNTNRWYYVSWTKKDTNTVTYRNQWCHRIKAYRRNAQDADEFLRFAVMVVAHEAMVIRGEKDEDKADCQALQRYVPTAMMLGATLDQAIEHARLYYKEVYWHDYHYRSSKCSPGGEWDENLPDAPWDL